MLVSSSCNGKISVNLGKESCSIELSVGLRVLDALVEVLRTRGNSTSHKE